MQAHRNPRRFSPERPDVRDREGRLRRLIAEYEATVRALAASLTPDNHALAVEIAGLPEQMRGYGHIKEKNVARTKEREASLLAAFHRPASAAAAAE